MSETWKKAPFRKTPKRKHSIQNTSLAKVNPLLITIEVFSKLCFCIETLNTNLKLLRTYTQLHTDVTNVKYLLTIVCSLHVYCLVEWTALCCKNSLVYVHKYACRHIQDMFTVSNRNARGGHLFFQTEINSRQSFVIPLLSLPPLQNWPPLLYKTRKLTWSWFKRSQVQISKWRHSLQA